MLFHSIRERAGGKVKPMEEKEKERDKEEVREGERERELDKDIEPCMLMLRGAILLK